MRHRIRKRLTLLNCYWTCWKQAIGICNFGRRESQARFVRTSCLSNRLTTNRQCNRRSWENICHSDTCWKTTCIRYLVIRNLWSLWLNLRRYCIRCTIFISNRYSPIIWYSISFISIFDTVCIFWICRFHRRKNLGAIIRSQWVWIGYWNCICWLLPWELLV